MGEPTNPPASDKQTSNRGRFRLWRWARRGLLALVGLAAVFVVFRAEEDWRGQRQWEACRAELERQGEKLDYSAYIPAPVPDEQNFAAAPVLRGLFDKSQRDKIFETAPSTHLAGLTGWPPERNWWKGERVDLAAWQHHFQLATNLAAQAKGTNAAEAVLRVLGRFDATLAQLREFGARPQSRYDVGYKQQAPVETLLPHLSYVKQTADVLGLRTQALLALGRVEEAGRDVDLMLKLSDSLRHEPFLISLLVRQAMLRTVCQTIWAGLADHQWTEAQLQRWQRQMSDMDMPVELLASLRAERSAANQTLDAMYHDPHYFVKMQEMEQPNSQPISGEWIARVWPSGWWRMEKANHDLDVQNLIVTPLLERAGRSQPARQTLREAQQVFVTGMNGMRKANVLQALFDHRIISSMLLPSFTGSFLNSAQTQSLIQMTATACALERQRLAAGAYPAVLDALAPDIQKDFVGRGPHWEVLRYHPANDGRFILYSDGWNGVDDGGVMVEKGKSLDFEQGDWVWPVPVEAAAKPGK